MERVESYKYLVFEFHATKNLAHDVSQVVSAAKKAMHSMICRCALLPISDPVLRCKLFDNLELPILSYASKVWGVDGKIDYAPELLHRQFMKHILGARDNTANVVVLAELGRFFWSHKVHSWLQGQSVGLSIEDDLDVSTVIGNAKNQYAQTWNQHSLSSVAR